MNSIKNIDENYFIIEGEVNYYEVVVEDEIKKSVKLSLTIYLIFIFIIRNEDF